ncbi:MAG: sensor histidine kinase, partial [Myxococcaceae bacterium]
YSPPDSQVRVVLRSRGPLAVLSVQDSGIGIPLEDQAHLFERYFRGRNASTRSFGGLGLGLYISRDIVERHGGEISVESTPGSGSKFQVSLPLISALGAQPAPSAELTH